MRKILALSALLFALLFGAPAQAAGLPPANMTASGAIVGSQIVWCPTGLTADFKCTFTQIGAFTYGLMSGDASASGTGGVTLATVNANVGSFGSATTCTAFTTNAKGLITAASAVTCTPAIGSITGMGTNVGAWLVTPSSANLAAALTDETGTGSAVFGTAPTISSPTINTAATFGFLTGSTQCLHVSTAGLVSGTGSDCGSGAGGVTSATGGIGITVSASTGAVTFSAPVTARNNTATTDTITSTDKGTLVTESNASAVAVAITTTGFVSTDYFSVKNLGAGPATYTPSSGNIDGGTLVCQQKQSADLYWDGTNLHQLASTCGLGALATATPGTGVATAAAVALSGAGGLTSTIASGTQALGTTAVGSAACSAAITASAPNTATTDVVLASFNGDPTAVTGYAPLTTGMLTIIAYPTSGNVNFKYCNNTSASITPGAITLNWRVVR